MRGPDVAYVGPERAIQARVARFPEMAPDLIIEVVSPSERAGRLRAKVNDYLRAGARLVVVLYPEMRSAGLFGSGREVTAVHEDDVLRLDPVLPGFACPLREIFE